MEPITATLTTAKEIYEAAKTIQKVYNVSKEMKTVAESEGKDQIMATKDLANTAADMKKGDGAEKSQTKNKGLDLRGDLLCEDQPGIPTIKGDFIDRLEPTGGSFPQPVEFVDKITEEKFNPTTQFESDGFVDLLSNDNSLPEKKIAKSDTDDITDSNMEKKQESLTEKEKQEIKEITGWSDKIVDAIRTKEEAQIYIDAGLVEGEINGKPALLQPDIDGKACNDSKWPDWNNKDLAEECSPPRDKNGRPYELHHIGQNPDSPLAELTYEQHHSDGNFKVLHTFDESSIDRAQFNKERKEYWSERSKSL